MASIAALVDTWCSPSTAEPALEPILAWVPSKLPLVDLLRSIMGPYLINSDGKVRARATSLIASLLASGGPTMLTSGSSAEAGFSQAVAIALREFFCGRLSDYPR